MQRKGLCLSAGEGRCCQSRHGDLFMLERLIVELIVALGSGVKAATATEGGRLTQLNASLGRSGLVQLISMIRMGKRF